MPRAPFQILVLPYRRTANTLEYAVLRRSDYLCWQGIAGGGEDDETPLEAAKREAWEETGLAASHFTPLQSTCTVPVTFFQGSGAWDPALYVIPNTLSAQTARAKRLHCRTSMTRSNGCLMPARRRVSPMTATGQRYGS